MPGRQGEGKFPLEYINHLTGQGHSNVRQFGFHSGSCFAGREWNKVDKEIAVPALISHEMWSRSLETSNVAGRHRPRNETIFLKIPRPECPHFLADPAHFPT